MSGGTIHTILFVDDSEANRYAGARLLRKAGFEVLEASTGQEALALLSRNPDLVAVDVHLPDTDGFSLCRRIKSESDSIPVLLMSATFTSTADQVQGLEGGADGYLVQPFELPVLMATIRAMFRIRAAEDKAHNLVQEWQTTFDAISDPIWIVDSEGIIVRCNQAMGQLCGAAPEQVQGRRVGDLIQESKASVVEPDKKALRSEREVRMQDRWFRVVCNPVQGDTAPATGIVEVWSDITERKKVEEERLGILAREQDARRQAEEANKVKDEFLATLSHELRTPLMSIIGWTSLLKAEELPAEELSMGLDAIGRNARTQAQIINDLLDVSRVMAGKLVLQMGPVDVVRTIQEGLESVRPTADEKDIRLVFPQATASAIINGDIHRFQQIVWNLLSNAVKFTPSGGEVKVEIERSAVAIKIAISDTGQGIEPQFLPHVFDRFRQADSSSTRRYGGLGLGLSIVRHLTELHSGTVHVESAGQDQGTTFILQFPLVAAVPVAPSVPKEELGAGALHNVKVQLVDDQSETRDVLTAILKHSGATVKASATAAEAFDLLPRWMPDILISDIGMPYEDGYCFIRRVRALAPEEGGQVPALALSAFANPTDSQKALEAGFQAFASKPISGDDLVAQLVELLDAARA